MKKYLLLDNKMIYKSKNIDSSLIKVEQENTFVAVFNSEKGCYWPKVVYEADTIKEIKEMKPNSIRHNHCSLLATLSRENKKPKRTIKKNELK